jgi:cytochrome c-type biogenesis protein CcmH
VTPARPVPGARPLAALVLVIVVALAVGGPALAAPAPLHRASLIAIENDTMCTACHESLAVAQSPEAYAERDYIRGLISQGETKAQIETNLVQQYGPAVLAVPPASGFNLLVYVVPPLVVIAGIILLVVTIPRWRRRARASAGQPLAVASALDPADARRLDEDLSHYA